MLATVRWNPTEFKFIGESEALSPGSFLQKLLDTIATRETYFGDLTPSHKTKYVSQSLSPQDVVTYLGSEDFYPGEFVKCISLVFLMQDKVYKMPLTLKARDRLKDLLRLKDRGTVTKQVLLPQDQTKEVFIYRRLDSPSDIKPLNGLYFPFAESVINALDELHRLGFTHLDLRLPNICFDRGNAVLIDLDDCQKIDQVSNVHDSESHMYSKEYDNVENYDWRQLAIILLRIWKCQDFDYHKGDLAFPTNEFGKELRECFDKGRKPNLDKLRLIEKKQKT